MWLIFALISALFFGIRGILYHWTSQKPLDRNLMLFGVFFTGMIVSYLLVLATGQKWSAASLLGILMGFFSFSANAAMYKGFAVGKASIVAIFTSLPPLVVIGIAYLLWGETLNLWQSIAFLIIVIGIIFIRYSSELSLTNLGGVQWGLLAMLFFGLNDVTSKQSMLLEAHIFPTLFIMFSTGTLLFCIFWMKGRPNENLLIRQNNSTPGQLPRWKAKPTFLWGMAVGLTNVSGMALLLPAFALGITGLVSAVVAINVLLILFYVRIFLKEKFNLKEIIGIICSLAGIVILHLLG
jgi:drug/metabolite transporter (DMT)-like permease